MTAHGRKHVYAAGSKNLATELSATGSTHVQEDPFAALLDDGTAIRSGIIENAMAQVA